MRLSKFKAPALPESAGLTTAVFREFLRVLRIYFSRVDDGFNSLIGRHGGRHLDIPNGLFWDNADQALVAINVAQPVRFNQTYLDSGMSINGATTSEITVEHSGVYNFQFSAMLRSSTASSKIVYIWINRNGTDVGYTAREYLIFGAGGILEINLDFNIDLQAGQYIQIMWTGNDIDLALDAVAPTSPHPGVPSAVVAVTFVSVLPENLPTPP